MKKKTARPGQASSSTKKKTPPEASGWGARGKDLIAALSLPLIVYVLYAGCLHGAFVFDDPNAISQSMLIRSIRPLDRFLTLSTRPLTDFSFALDYARGQLDPHPYHVTNLVIHALNGILVYFLALRTLGILGLGIFSENRRGISWAAAALFVAHPLATETVAYVSSRSEALVALFILITLLIYAHGATSSKRRKRIATAVFLPLTTSAALASKEIAAVIPPALFLYDWCFLARGNWRRTKPRWGFVALTLLPLLTGGLFLVYRAYNAKVSFGSYSASAGFQFDRFGPGKYFMTQLGVLVHYLRLVLVPVGLTFDYDWHLATSPWSPGVLLPFAILLLLGILALRNVRTQPFYAFAILWMFLVLAPTSSVMPLADLVVERRMYIPLIGFALLAATWGWLLVGRVRRGRSRSWPQALGLYAALIGIPLCLFGGLTASRASLWGNELALHLDGVAKAPGNPRVRLNLGVTYLNRQQLEEAEVHLREAKRLYDKGESLQCFQRIGAFIHYNLGAVYFLRGKYNAAIPQLKRALELGGEYLALRPMAYYLLGNIAMNRKNWKIAAGRFQEAIRFRKDQPQWYLLLAQAQLQSGQRKLAQKTLRQARHRFPDNTQLAAFQQQLQAVGKGTPR